MFCSLRNFWNCSTPHVCDIILTMATKLVIAGVPEQVNIPVNICAERGIFKKHGIEVEVAVVPEGTGKMLEMIENGTTDIAITVSDAFMAGRAKGRAIQLCGTWVGSPLIWTIAASPDQLIMEDKHSTDLASLKVSDDQDIKIGVSRLGSGSHTMAQYAAMLANVDQKSLEFSIANSFEGLRAGVENGDFQAFLWEKFTTKPWFDNQDLRCLGEVPTPWPAFVFVSSDSLSVEKAEAIRDRLFPALYEGLSIFIQEALDDPSPVADMPVSIQRIMDAHGHTEADARLWLSKCRYAADEHMAVDKQQMENSVQILRKVGLVPDTFATEQLWSNKAGVANTVITVN